MKLKEDLYKENEIINYKDICVKYIYFMSYFIVSINKTNRNIIFKLKYQFSSKNKISNKKDLPSIRENNIFKISSKKYYLTKIKINILVFLKKYFFNLKFFLFFSPKKNELNTDLTNLIPNQILNRVSNIQYYANNPVEDRLNAIQLTNLNGYYLSVLDGHGGSIIVDYAYKHIPSYFDERIKSLENSDFHEDYKIIDAFNYSFQSVENDLFQMATQDYLDGKYKIAFCGCCILSIVVYNNKLYIANLGDSRSELYSKNDYGEYSSQILNNIHNAKVKSEQKRLRLEFPNEPDIILSRNLGNSAYVKGRLQPTRALGDFYLKYKVFNDNLDIINVTDENKKQLEKYKKKIITNFNGPYIKSKPDIIIHDLKYNDDFIIIASDGLWDFISSKEAKKIVEKYRDKDKIARDLFSTTMQQVAISQSISTEEIYNLKPGNDKRNIHDDITIMVVDIRNQFEKKL